MEKRIKVLDRGVSKKDIMNVTCCKTGPAKLNT